MAIRAMAMAVSFDSIDFIFPYLGSKCLVIWTKIISRWTRHAFLLKTSSTQGYIFKLTRHVVFFELRSLE